MPESLVINVINYFSLLRLLNLPPEEIESFAAVHKHAPLKKQVHQNYLHANQDAGARKNRKASSKEMILAANLI